MDSSIDLIILAIIAGFIIFKLFNILGRGEGDNAVKTQHKRKIVDIFPIEEKEDEPNLNFDQQNEELDPKTKEIFENIQKIDSNFNKSTFIKKATNAFEIILKAYAEADQKTLKNLLAKKVYDDFCQNIDKHKANETKLYKTLVAIISSSIEKVQLNKNLATITTKFVTQQINIIKDKNNQIIEGNPSHIDTIEDTWKFERDLTSKSPIWQLIETNSSLCKK